MLFFPLFTLFFSVVTYLLRIHTFVRAFWKIQLEKYVEGVIQILRSENEFTCRHHHFAVKLVFSFACMCLCWWVGTWVGSSASCCHQGTLRSFVLSHCPLRKVLLLPAEMNLDHRHHSRILVCVTRAKPGREQAAFKKYTTWELHTTFPPPIPLARTQSHGYIQLLRRPRNVSLFFVLFCF